MPEGLAGAPGPGDRPCEALLIGGRAGVGKSTVGWEISVRLAAADVGHALVEGDNLDQIHPAPAHDPTRAGVTEANLAAIWGNYAALGCRRLIYTNTVSIIEPDLIIRAMGGAVRTTSVLLTARDTTALERLRGREIGSRLEPHIVRSARMAAHLEVSAPAHVVRIPTDGRAVIDIADEIIAATGWTTHVA